MAAIDLQSFVQTFVRPLIAGGDLVIAEPLDLDDLDRLRGELPRARELCMELDRERERAVAELVMTPATMFFGEDDLSLCAALYNALFLVHPQAPPRGSVRAKVVLSSLQMAARSPVADAAAALARHALLRNMFRLGRRDTKVSWWTGGAFYYGQNAPARLRRWKGLRRVQESVAITTSAGLFAGADPAKIVAAIAEATPLTTLLYHELGAPLVRWENSTFVLRDRDLARAVAYLALLGDGPSEQVVAPARLTEGLEAMLERSPDPDDVRAVVAFLVHLNVLLMWPEIKVLKRARSPLLAAALHARTADDSLRPGLASFFALPNATRRIDDRLCTPTGLPQNPAAWDAWRKFIGEATEIVGEEKTAELASRLARALA